MTNGEKYKSFTERWTAFQRICNKDMDCEKCPFKDYRRHDDCAFAWLAEEYKDTDGDVGEKTPFIVAEEGAVTVIRRVDTDAVLVCRDTTACGSYLRTLCDELNDAALAWHNMMIEKGE